MTNIPTRIVIPLVVYFLGTTIIVIYYMSNQDKMVEQYKPKKEMIYSNGVNDALDAFVLLTLELKMNEEVKTYGAMCDIVRQRLSVEKRMGQLKENYNEQER